MILDIYNAWAEGPDPDRARKATTAIAQYLEEMYQEHGRDIGALRGEVRGIGRDVLLLKWAAGVQFVLTLSGFAVLLLRHG